VSGVSPWPRNTTLPVRPDSRNARHAIGRAADVADAGQVWMLVEQHACLPLVLL